jgi:hypothetical protein
MILTVKLAINFTAALILLACVATVGQIHQDFGHQARVSEESTDGVLKLLGRLEELTASKV